MAEPIINANSSFFNNNATVSPIKKTVNTQTPIKVATQEFTKGAIKDNKTISDTTPQISFSDAINQAKAVTTTINAGKIQGMNQADAIKYAQRSISDLEQKMAQVASLSAVRSTSNTSSQNQQAPMSANNTQVSNNVSNVTNITSDYLRNMRSDYEKTPQWRSDLG
jgi:hypothetical protein